MYLRTLVFAVGKETALERAEFALQLLEFVTAKRLRKRFSHLFLLISSKDRLRSPRPRKLTALSNAVSLTARP